MKRFGIVWALCCSALACTANGTGDGSGGNGGDAAGGGAAAGESGMGGSAGDPGPGGAGGQGAGTGGSNTGGTRTGGMGSGGVGSGGTGTGTANAGSGGTGTGGMKTGGTGAGGTMNTGGAPADPKAKRWVFLMLGQSNMAGSATCEAQDVVAPNRIFKMAKNKSWAPGHESYNISPWSSETGAPCKVGDRELGPSRAFGVNVLAGVNDPEVDIRIVNAAYSGSNIESWNPAGNPGGDAHFAPMLTYLDEALKTGVLRGFIWHQGEANGGTDPATYANRLAAIIAAIRTRAKQPLLPVVAGETGTTSDNGNVNRALGMLVQSDPNFAVATSENLSLEDNVHYNSASQREFGKRYAAAWWSIVNR